MTRIKTGFRLMKKSFRTLNNDRSLAWFPVLSALASIAFLIVLVLPVGGGAYAVFGEEMFENSIILYSFVFLALLISAFITVFFNVALTAQAIRSFDGEDTNIKDGVQKAWSHKGAIFKWAILAAVVGTILRIIEERVPFGRFLSFLGGAVWSVASWFVVPILATEEIGPIDALKKSGQTVKSRWGEGVTGIISINAIVAIPALLLIIIGVIGGVFLFPVSVLLGGAFVFLILLALIALSVIGTAAAQIFNAAVYLSIKENADSVGLFTSNEINGAVRMKN